MSDLTCSGITKLAITIKLNIVIPETSTAQYLYGRAPNFTDPLAMC